MKIVKGLVVGFLLFGMVGAANADLMDNFEDGNHDGWLVGSATGNGSTGVEEHNASQMAFITQTGSGTHSLAIDFGYVPSDTLSFDMHAIAAPSDQAQASSGAVVSFLNTFNTTLGYMRLINNTSGSYGTYDISVDGQQHNFSALLSEWAAVAGLGASDPISKVNLSYFATAQTFQHFSSPVPNLHNHYSSATVWFDNVNVGDVNPVPAPGAIILGILGLGAVGVKLRNFV